MEATSLFNYRTSDFETVESYSDILSVIRNIELSTPSKKYRIQWVK